MVPMCAHIRHLSLLQRSHDRIRGLALAPFFGLLLVGLLAGCGSGGGGSSSGGGGDVPPSAAPTTVVGVAATGAPIVGTVTLKDVVGATRTATTSATGAFSLDVSGLTPPYILQVVNNPGTVTLYSIATSHGTANINPLSHLILHAVAMNVDPTVTNPADVFADPRKFKALTQTHVNAATGIIMGKLSPDFKAMLRAQGASNINPIIDHYAIGNGLDKTFDAHSLTLDTVTGALTDKENATGIVTLIATQGDFRSIATPRSYDQN